MEKSGLPGSAMKRPSASALSAASPHAPFQHTSATGRLSSAAAARPRPAAASTIATEDEEPPVEYVGKFDSKIVGIQYYNGIISKRERLILRRQPDNKYDKNAISVHNAADIMVGHIPREVAAILAPLIDKGTTVVDACTTTKGLDNVYKIPIVMEVYAIEKLRQQIVEILKSRRYVIENFSTDAAQYQVGGRIVPQDKFDDVMSAVFSSLSIENSFPEDRLQEPKSPSFVGELLPYQKHGLAWLLDREAVRKIPFGEENSFSVSEVQGGAPQGKKKKEEKKKDATAEDTGKKSRTKRDREEGKLAAGSSSAAATKGKGEETTANAATPFLSQIKPGSLVASFGSRIPSKGRTNNKHLQTS